MVRLPAPCSKTPVLKAQTLSQPGLEMNLPLLSIPSASCSRSLRSIVGASESGSPWQLLLGKARLPQRPAWERAAGLLAEGRGIGGGRPREEAVLHPAPATAFSCSSRVPTQCLSPRDLVRASFPQSHPSTYSPPSPGTSHPLEVGLWR